MDIKFELYKGYTVLAKPDKEGDIIVEAIKDGREVCSMGSYDTVDEAIADMKNFIDKDFVVSDDDV